MQASSSPVPPRRLAHHLALAAVLILAIILHLARLTEEGYANMYYAATVRSMLTSWHNFFFASFDPGGFVSVDKPPLGFWVQALGVMIFGLSGWSLLLPQAVAGVLSVVLIYHLVARVFGSTAGLIAALALAVTPISIAANRNNTVDAQLVFVLLLATWAVSVAVERGQLRWLIVCMILVGIGFNIKMLQAYMVLPAFYATYLIAARTAWWKRIAHLAVATIPLIVVSFAWIAVVDLTPTDARPYVGSSHNNTEMELVVGHNGISRLGQIANWLGLRGAPPQQQARLQPPPNNLPGNPRAQLPPLRRGQAPLPRNQPGSPPNFAPNPPSQPQPAQLSAPRGLQDETGEASLLRLFNQQLAGQISWFLPLAFLGFFVATLATRLKYPFVREHQQLLLWITWLVLQVLFFSFAGLFHRYYLEMLAPAIAALVGIGFAAMWNIYIQHRWRGLILPAAIVIGAAAQAFILFLFRDWIGWLIPLLLVSAFGLAVSLVLARLAPSVSRLHATLATLGVLVLFVAPMIWSVTPVLGADAGLPFAGPELLARPARGQMPLENPVVSYLVANRGGAEFLAATVNANTAAPIILATGEPVMAVGGFSGSDRILLTDQFAHLVESNVVRFFVLTQQGNQNEVSRWVEQHCAQVALRAAPTPTPGGQVRLYDCARGR